MSFVIKDLAAGTEGKKILNGVSLTVGDGELHALMGPNGSGKSTLANVLMGSPLYDVYRGSVTLDGNDVLAMDAPQRSLAGMFMAFQYPVEVPGVTVGRFMKRLLEKRESGGERLNVGAVIKELRSQLDNMGLSHDFMNRYLNQGFSGGEKKRMEILQMLMLKPHLAILDETDSGLDIDALKVVARGVARLRGSGFSALVITHYRRILDYLDPDYVHVMVEGKIALSGGGELTGALESRGYDWVREQTAGNVEVADAAEHR